MRHLKYSPVVLLVVFLITIMSSSRIWGQANLGAIKGETQDAQHSAVPNVKLTLKNESTGVVATSSSGASGEYSFLNLEPGTYSLTSEASGFGTAIHQHIVVNVGSTVTLPVTLQVGQDQQSVVVSADLASLENQTSDINTVITPEEIKDLPVSLQGDMRNPLNFVVLTPGVNGSTPGSSPDYRLHFSGSPSQGDEIYIDGVPIMNPNNSGDISLSHPPIDAISQFKVVTNNQTAQYGLSSGIVSFGFKSGGNDFHGSLFEFLQNDALNAAGYVTNRLHLKKAPLKQNEYGGTFGGAVRIPKLYDGRDHTFFFVDFTGFKYRPSSNNATLTTIPNAFRKGDFSQLLGPQLTSANGTPVVDPAGRPVYAGQIYDPHSVHTVTGPDGKPYQVRDPFPGNVIPNTYPNLSQVSQKILQDFPEAKTDALVNNFYRLQSSKIDEHRLVIKIDEHPSEKQSFSGSIFTGGYSNSNNGGLNLLDATTTTSPTLQIRLMHTYVWSPTLLNTVNIGFLRDKGFSGPLQAGPGLQALGLNGLPDFTSISGYPLIGLGTVINSIGTTAGGAAAQTVGNRYYFNDNLTFIRGPHTFTVGGEVRREYLNELGADAGSFIFEPTQSALNGVGFANGTSVSLPASTGHPAASFLLGGMDYTHSDYPIAQYYRWWQIGSYLQDDWRASRKLTLNLGVRYDIQVPRTEKNGNVSSMDPTVANPSAGGVLGAYTFYGSGSGRNGKPRIGDIYYTGIQPRFGFSYAADNKTVVRGGMALTRPIGNDNMQGGFTGGYNFGFAGIAQLNHPGNYVGDPAYYWDNAFPSSGVTAPGANLNPGIVTGPSAPVWISSNVGLPPTQIYWTTQVQREITKSMTAHIGYVGMHIYHVGNWSKPNEINPAKVNSQYGSAAAAAGMPLNEFLSLPIGDPRVTAAGITAPWDGFASTFGGGATAGQALRPTPQYGDVDHPLNPIASASYNGLQTSLQQRFTNGLTFLLSYSFSKTIGNVDSNSGPSAGAENAIWAGSFYQDYYNPRAERTVTSSDIPHVLSLSYTYELPFGRNKRYLNHGVLSRAAGGWSVSGIHQYQSGRPIHIEYDAFGSSNPYFAAGDGFSFRPNIVPHQPFKNPAYKRDCSGPIQSTAGRNPCQFYINPAAFTAPPAGEFGNGPNFVSALRMPRYLNEDLSVSKRTQLYENLNLQFQANFFNAFNRTIFSNGGNAQTFIINAAPPDLSSTSLSNSSTVFGIMSAQQNAPRIIQFSLKLEF